MQSNIRIKVDESAYEYSCFVWASICGEKPQKVVSLLSEGKGIVSKQDSPTHEKIALLMQKVNLFVPRVRMEKDFGYRTANARWYSSLLKRKKSLKCLPEYLCDAVNQIIAKPYQDQIRQLRDSIRTEIRLKKEKKSLTPEQDAKIKDVTAKINDQKKKLAHQPKCTNDILTTLLHEYVDSPSQDDVVRLQNLTNEITSLDAVLKTYMERFKEASDDSISDSRLSLEKMIEDTKSKMNQRKRLQYEIRKKYYERFRREMTPQAIADQLMKYPGTFWEQFNRSVNIIDVNVKIYTSNKTGKKVSKKQSTLAKCGEALLLFPHAVLDTKIDEEFLAAIDNDLKVYEEWDLWAREHPEKIFSQSYKEAYENYRKQFKTIPTIKNHVHMDRNKEPSTLKPDIIPPSPLSQYLRYKPNVQNVGNEFKTNSATEERNKYENLMGYLYAITVNDATGRKKIEDAKEIILAFTKLEDFDARCEQLRRMIDSGTVKFPGGFAVTEMNKMLNPDYNPNIR